jgi:hypothetical protein
VSLLLVGTVAVLLGAGSRKSWKLVLAAIAGLAAVIVSSIFGWRLFGLASAMLAVLTLITLPSREPGKRVPWWINLTIAACVAVAAIAWQVNTPIRFSTVVLAPAVNPALPDVPMPYFG